MQNLAIAQTSQKKRLFFFFFLNKDKETSEGNMQVMLMATLCTSQAAVQGGSTVRSPVIFCSVSVTEVGK